MFQFRISSDQVLYHRQTRQTRPEITVKLYCECSIRECFSLESVVIKYCTTGRPGRLKRLPTKLLSAGGRCVKVIS